MKDQYLIHHGIKGQKWGVRRFQEENGSLTTAGKARYLSESGSSINPKGSAPSGQRIRPQSKATQAYNKSQNRHNGTQKFTSGSRKNPQSKADQAGYKVPQKKKTIADRYYSRYRQADYREAFKDISSKPFDRRRDQGWLHPETGMTSDPLGRISYKETLDANMAEYNMATQTGGYYTEYYVQTQVNQAQTVKKIEKFIRKHPKLLKIVNSFLKKLGF